MLRLVFIDDDPTELEEFRGIVQRDYECITIDWPSDSARLFSCLAPSIFVSDLYLPPPSGDSVPTPEQRDFAANAAREVAERFARLYRKPSLDDKARLKETMKAITAAYRLLKLQWESLGQSPEHGVALFAKLKASYPGVPLVFYSRKITPEDVIRVLQAGAVDAIRKGALNNEEVLARLTTAQEIFHRDDDREVRAMGLNLNVTPT